MRRRYLFSYDVSDDARRDKIFKTLRDHGDHAQYSVFFCELNATEYAELHGRLDPLLHHGEDQMLILDLGPAKRSLSECLEVLGRPYRPPGRCLVL
ncbi:MAG: CRISPR-associated endonuclease Cas2 [Planctomycetota bacterium]